MKILKQNKGEMFVLSENLDDIWCLSQIIDKGDLVKGMTQRKIKIGDSGDRKQTVVKKNFLLEIKVEKVEFSKSSNQLRIAGKITEGKEDIPKGSFHTIEVDEGTKITITKLQWLKYQIDKIKDAAKEKKGNILLIIHDRETAFFAKLQKSGYEILSELKGTVAKKADQTTQKLKNFYDEIINQIKEYNLKYKKPKIIIASPAFWKEDLMKSLKDPELKKQISFATVSESDKSAFNELLRRPEVKNVLHEDRVTQEIKAVEKLLSEISKDDKASYGMKETKDAVNAGAVETLLVTDNLILKKREEDKFYPIEKIMKTTEQVNGKVMIISSDHEGGKKLDGLGGIAAILRYKM
ncbi:mRNA surveillance protein pelota [Nanoarchaeota archaeon]